jgi:chromosome segregation ATPase
MMDDLKAANYRIEILEAEVERLRADNLAMREVMKDEAVRLAIVVNERADLRAEVERLRALYQASEKERTVYRAEVERLRAELEARPKVYFPVEETAREVDRLLKAIDVAEKNTEDRQAEVERLRAERLSIGRVLDDEEAQLALERKLRMRVGGLTKAVGEMEPGAREFCLAAIDEWLDYMVALRDHLDGTEAEVERLRGENSELRKAFESDEYAIEQAAEIERLRAALEKDPLPEYVQLKAEIDVSGPEWVPADGRTLPRDPETP